MSRGFAWLRLAAAKGYSVNRQGRVRSHLGRWLSLCGKRYLTFGVYCAQRKRIYILKVHRFVAFKKYGDQLFTPGLEVRHLNNKKQDNRWSNIMLGTPSQNRMDLPSEVRVRSVLASNRVMRKLTAEQV